MLSREATDTNIIVFCLTLSGLELTIYRTQGEHAYQSWKIAELVLYNNHLLNVLVMMSWKIAELVLNNNHLLNVLVMMIQHSIW
jgi:hypothetical protein